MSKRALGSGGNAGPVRPAGRRVSGPLVAPAAYLQTVEISAALWSTGFAIFTVRYTPILCRPRLDGRPG